MGLEMRPLGSPLGLGDVPVGGFGFLWTVYELDVGDVIFAVLFVEYEVSVLVAQEVGKVVFLFIVIF